MIRPGVGTNPLSHQLHHHKIAISTVKPFWNGMTAGCADAVSGKWRYSLREIGPNLSMINDSGERKYCTLLRMYIVQDGVVCTRARRGVGTTIYSMKFSDGLCSCLHASRSKWTWEGWSGSSIISFHQSRGDDLNEELKGGTRCGYGLMRSPMHPASITTSTN